jgi:hypothetical protein
MLEEGGAMTERIFGEMYQAKLGRLQRIEELEKSPTPTPEPGNPIILEPGSDEVQTGSKYFDRDSEGRLLRSRTFEPKKEA